ncbi:MAG: hypothetical protein K2H40_00965 [Lachnospiraceae bacterium]|nr:hypothetical protein [Lachnospiraceae bacterium]
MKIIKKITALNMTVVIMMISLTGCGGFDTDDISDTPERTEDVLESQLPETIEEATPLPETYEDYMKLAAENYDKQDWETALAFYQGAKELDDSREEVYRGQSDAYLHMDDVVRALAILDEGIEKCGFDSLSQKMLSQRKAYVLAGMVAIRTKLTEIECADDGNTRLCRLLEYDENGNEITDIFCGEKEKNSNVSEYQYDENGNRTEYLYISYNNLGDTNIFFHETCVYDENGNEIEYVSYSESGYIKKKTESEYDANGNQVKQIEYDGNDEIVKWTETTYDTFGNRIKIEVYNEQGTCIRTTLNDYDERGNQTKHMVYGDHENIIGKEEYEYDQNGNEIRYTKYDDGVTVSYWYEKEYDENGNEVRHISYHADGTMGYWYEQAYDEKGNQIKFVSYNEDGSIEWISEYEYDENCRVIYKSYENDYGTMQTWENDYDECGNQIKAAFTIYDGETGQEKYRKVDEFAYDENGNMTEYDHTEHEGKEVENPRWKREYDEDGRKAAFYFYDHYANEKIVSYQSKTAYDENGLMIKYTGYDEEGNVLVRKETEYDEAGKVIRETHYDADGNPVQYYENEYDDFGSVTRQTMYQDGILEYEKQMSYVYRYIGNIDTETADYMDNDMTMEEYNQKQREIFNRFLSGQEEIRYCSAFNSIGEGKIVRDTITDLIDFAYYEENEAALKYTFLDMTGDGIEELIINCIGDNLYIIQSDHGILKVIGRTVGGNLGTYLVKYDGRTGICCNFGGHVGENEEIYYFYDGKGKKEISLRDYQDFQEDGTESRSYSISDNDSFESRDISTGEYYDVSGTIVTITVDWHPLEEPVR